MPRQHIDPERAGRGLIDGLHEFPATEVLMLEGGERDWADAERFAERVMTEIGLPVTQVETSQAALVAA